MVLERSRLAGAGGGVFGADQLLEDPAQRAMQAFVVCAHFFIGKSGGWSWRRPSVRIVRLRAFHAPAIKVPQ